MVHAHAAIDEQAGQQAVQDGRAHLALDIVADDGQFLFLETRRPIRRGGNENRHGVDHAHACLESLFHIPLGGHFRTDRQEVDEHMRAGVFEDLDDIVGRSGGLFQNLLEILAQAVMGHAARDLDTHMGHVRELIGVVGIGKNGFGKVFADLGGDHVESGHELDIAHVVAAQVDVHQTGHAVGVFGVFVKLDALNNAEAQLPTPMMQPYLLSFAMGFAPLNESNYLLRLIVSSCAYRPWEIRT